MHLLNMKNNLPTEPVASNQDKYITRAEISANLNNSMKNIEIETKILDIDKDSTQFIIESLGWEKIWEWEILWSYYIKWDDKIRIRKEERWYVVCTKKNISTDKWVLQREENEVVITNPEEFHQLIALLWYTKSKDIAKYRTSYSLMSHRIDIDFLYAEWIHILEIEGTDIWEIEKIVTLLWFSTWNMVSARSQEAIDRIVRSKNILLKMWIKPFVEGILTTLKQ